MFNHNNYRGKERKTKRRRNNFPVHAPGSEFILPFLLNSLSVKMSLLMLWLMKCSRIICPTNRQ